MTTLHHYFLELSDQSPLQICFFFSLFPLHFPQARAFVPVLCNAARALGSWDMTSEGMEGTQQETRVGDTFFSSMKTGTDNTSFLKRKDCDHSCHLWRILSPGLLTSSTCCVDQRLLTHWSLREAPSPTSRFDSMLPAAVLLAL